MGVIIDGDLRYLAAATGDEYHRMRADDSTAWMMQNLELYPEKSGYGQYGITSERFCPSDAGDRTLQRRPPLQLLVFL